MNSRELTPKITLWVINLLMAFVILFGLFISISVFVAVRPFKKLLPSTEGVAQWRSHSNVEILGYKLDVDHVYKSQDSSSEYYKMVSFRIPGARYAYPSNTDSLKKVMKSKNDPYNVYTSVDWHGSELTLRIKDNSLQNYLLLGFTAIVCVVISLVILWLWNFKLLIKNLSKDETHFNHENVKRLRLLGMIMLVFSLGQLISTQMINFFMVSNFDFVSSGNVKLDFNLPIVIIVFALTLLTLSSVFNHGIRIKEEQELTV